jgi:hypothetical protein
MRDQEKCLHNNYSKHLKIIKRSNGKKISENIHRQFIAKFFDWFFLFLRPARNGYSTLYNKIKKTQNNIIFFTFHIASK